jgi:hypothetical protein
MKNIWAWILGLGLIVGAVVFALKRDLPDRGLQAHNFSEQSGGGDNGKTIVPKDTPVVIGFVGDLLVGGDKRQDGSVIPFVIGEVLKLDADAVNAIEYRWMVNGEVIKDKEQEWSKVKNREYEVVKAGELQFSVQVRGANPDQVSAIKDIKLKTVPVYIESFEAALVHDDDRALIGDDYTVEVTLAEPITADDDFYLLRYSVNDMVVKHPDDEKEWTVERQFTYTFPSPGQYSFKVEVRRATEREVEASAILAETIVAAEAIVLSFDAVPDKYAPLGSTIDLEMFPQSLFGKSECRFGFKKVTAAEFQWIADDDGSVWGHDQRKWLPTEAGNYILRGEVREPGKPQADDSREILYQIVDGDF